MRTQNILILTQWSYNDALIQAYTLPYVRIIAGNVPAGSKIYLVTFEQEQIALEGAEKAAVKAELLKKGIHLITFGYTRFGILAVLRWAIAMIRLWMLIMFRNISYIHAWCTPAGSLGYVLSVFTGRKLLIDSYEPHAEAMVENKTWSANGMKFKLLFYLEKKLSARASYIISATEGMKEYALRKYGVVLKNFSVKPACVDLQVFNPSHRKKSELLKELKLEDKIVCVYAGKFGGIYLTEEVFRFLHFAQEKWGNKFSALLLTSYDKEELFQWAKKNGFSEENLIVRFVSHKDIADYMGLGDFAITPVKPIPTKRYCTPIKDGEYWALGLPVVITKDISDDSDIIKKHQAGVIIEELNDAGYISAIDQIADMLLKKNDDAIFAVAKKYRSFEIAEKIYKDIYGKKT